MAQANQEARGRPQAADEVVDARGIGAFHMQDAYVDQGYQAAVGPAAAAIYTTLCRHADRNGRSFPGIDRLMLKTGQGKNTVIRAIRRLEDHGLVRVERRRDERQRQEGNVYHLQPKGKWNLIAVKAEPGAKMEPGYHGDKSTSRVPKPGAKAGCQNGTLRKHSKESQEGTPYPAKRGVDKNKGSITGPCKSEDIDFPMPPDVPSAQYGLNRLRNARMNPRALGTNPRAIHEASRTLARAAWQRTHEACRIVGCRDGFVTVDGVATMCRCLRQFMRTDNGKALGSPVREPAS